MVAGAAIGVAGMVSATLVKDYITDSIVKKVAKCFSSEAHIWEEHI